MVLGPTSKCRWAYAQSKMIDESLGLAYQREYGLDVVAFRLFNTVGPRQTDQYGMVIPTFVRQALRRQPITVYGNGSQRRCFCDVRDVVAAIVSWRRETSIRGKCSISEARRRPPFSAGPANQESNGQPCADPPHSYEHAYGAGFEDMAYRMPDTRRIRGHVGWSTAVSAHRNFGTHHRTRESPICRLRPWVAKIPSLYQTTQARGKTIPSR